jgi:hypothetical protein
VAILTEIVRRQHAQDAVAGSSSFSLLGANSLFFNGRATAGGRTTTAYTFDAPSNIPEPATMTLIGSALLSQSVSSPASVSRKLSLLL